MTFYVDCANWRIHSRGWEWPRLKRCLFVARDLCQTLCLYVAVLILLVPTISNIMGREATMDAQKGLQRALAGSLCFICGIAPLVHFMILRPTLYAFAVKARRPW